MIKGSSITAFGFRYVEKILVGYFVSFARFIGLCFFLVYDNARPHTANQTSSLLGTKQLKLPAYTRDLNPYEHEWEVIMRRDKGRENLNEHRIKI